jgi:adenine-specific DNA-methyltransferase
LRARKLIDFDASVAECAAIVTSICTYYRRQPVGDARAALTVCLALVKGEGPEKILSLLTQLPPAWSDHAIASVYAVLMPGDQRKRLGAYFTPPHLVGHLLLRMTALGMDISRDRLRDPASGGAAFLVPIGRDMVGLWLAQGIGRKRIVRMLAERLIGSEIDSNLAKLANALICRMLCGEFGFSQAQVDSMRQIVRKRDGLLRPHAAFDHEVGNPPYRRLYAQEQNKEIERFADIRSGRLNLYAMFVRSALIHAPVGGLIGHVIPSSFLGGPEFAAFRQTVSSLAEVLVLDVVEKRSDVFLDAVQDACFIVLKKRPAPIFDASPHQAISGVLRHDGVLVENGKMAIPTSDAPWALPDPQSDQGVSGRSIREMGWRATVGYLVANRAADRMHERPARGRYPLIWAACVLGDGTFDFDRGRLSRQANGMGYVSAKDHARYVVRGPCVVVQRTSSRSQGRRLVAAAIPREFLERHSGAIGENHTLLLIQERDDAISAEELAALLNTPEASDAFSRVSGSASISAKLLNNLRLPI